MDSMHFTVTHRCKLRTVVIGVDRSKQLVNEMHIWPVQPAGEWWARDKGAAQ